MGRERMTEKSIFMRVDPTLRTAMELTRKRAEINYKLEFKTERKFTDREITKILAVKILHDNYRIPIEQVLLIINGHERRRR
jgi:hypothetical protein